MSERPMQGTVAVPGSKSLTARYLLLAAMASGPSTLISPLQARDTVLLSQALTACGVTVAAGTQDGLPTWTVDGTLHAPAHPLDAGLAGTILRFLPAVLAHVPGATTFVGDERAAQRPLEPLLAALRHLGARCDTPRGLALPLTVHGVAGLRGGQVEVDASASSQFLSALLLTGTLFREGLTITHRSPVGAPLPSRPHVEMTCAVARHYGAVIDAVTEVTWRVHPGTLHGGTFAIEPDLTNAATFVAAVAVRGGTLHFPQWPSPTTQAGDHIRAIVEAMGASCLLSSAGLTVTATGQLRGIDITMAQCGELLPVVAALAACATTPSTLRGVGHVRGHESDRLQALATELTGCGASVQILDDGLRITPGTPQPHTFRTYHDHRLVMAAAVMSLRTPGLVVEDPGAVNKTFPTFPHLWDATVGGTHE